MLAVLTRDAYCSSRMGKSTSITVRRVPEDIKRRLRLRAAARGRSLEEEVRQILSRAAKETEGEPLNFAKAIAEIIDPVGGIELDLPLRSPMREPPRFDDVFEDEDQK